MTGRERLKRRMLKVCVFVVSLLASLAVAEGVLRLTAQKDVRVLEKVPGTEFYRLKPNLCIESGGKTFRTNSDGFVGSKEYPKEKTLGLERVMVIGDSTAQGDLDADVPYPAVLSAALEDHEVINAAVSGFNGRTIREYFAGHLAQWSPDIIIYGLCLNDILPPAGVDASGRMAEAGPSPGIKTRNILKSSRILVRAVRAVDVVRAGRNSPPVFHDRRAWAEYSRNVQGYYNDETLFEEFIREIELLRKACEGSGARFLVVILPLASAEKSARAQEKLAERFRREGIRYLDVTATVYKRGPFGLFLPADPVHLNNTGHRLVAELIARELLERDLDRP
jgi:lysophospholipase L1-like esterase